MPSLLRCPECDRPLKIPDEMLGKTVKGPCGHAFVAREGEAAPAPPPAAAFPMACPHCGEKMRIPEVVRGKKVKCRKCNEPFAVPAEETAVAAAPAKPKAERADEVDEAKPAPRRRRERDEEDEDEPRRRKRRKPARSSGGRTALIVVGSIVAVVLALFGAIAWVGWQFYKGVEQAANDLKKGPVAARPAPKGLDGFGPIGPNGGREFEPPPQGVAGKGLGFATPGQAADAYLKAILELDVASYKKIIARHPFAVADFENTVGQLKTLLPDRDDAFRRRAALNNVRMELVTNDVTRYPPLPAGPTGSRVYLTWPVSFAVGPTIRRLDFHKSGDQWYWSGDDRQFGENHGFPTPPPPGATPLIAPTTPLAALDYDLLADKNLLTPAEVKTLLPKLRLKANFDEAGKIISLDPSGFLDDKGLLCVYSLASPRIQRLNVHGGDRISDGDLEKLSRLTGLEELSIDSGYAQVTDKGLAHLGKLTNLKTLRLGAPLASDAGFAFLESLPRLEQLILRGRFSDGALKHLAGASQLQTLLLERGLVQGPGLEHLRGLKELSTLSLLRNKLTGPGLEHLGTLPKLRSVDLSANALTDDGLKALGSCALVENLRLDLNQITDAGFAHLRGAAQLRHLSLSSNRISGSGLAQLKGLGQLDGLELWNNPLTDVALKNLGGLPKLNFVSISESPNLSAAALQKLRKDVPQVSVMPSPK